MSFCFRYVVVTCYQGAASPKPLPSQIKSVPFFCSEPYEDTTEMCPRYNRNGFYAELHGNHFAFQLLSKPGGRERVRGPWREQGW